MPEIESSPYKNSIAVLAYIEYQIEIASYHDGAWHVWFNEWVRLGSDTKVTHWMPLPPPPEQESE
jgi:hypothetical protein